MRRERVIHRLIILITLLDDAVICIALLIGRWLVRLLPLGVYLHEGVLSLLLLLDYYVASSLACCDTLDVHSLLTHL